MNIVYPHFMAAEASTFRVNADNLGGVRKYLIHMFYKVLGKFVPVEMQMGS